MINSISELFRAAETLEASGNAAGAAELYKRWTALNPEDPHLAAALFNMAVVAQRSGDGFGAIHALRQAIRLNPDFHPPYINLGRLLEDNGQAGLAVSQWLDLSNRLPQLTGAALRHKLMALQQVGRVLEFNHVDAAAEDALRQAIDLDPRQPQAVQHWIALRQKQCKWPVIAGWDGAGSRDLLASISPLSAAVMFDDLEARIPNSAERVLILSIADLSNATTRELLRMHLSRACAAYLGRPRRARGAVPVSVTEMPLGERVIDNIDRRNMQRGIFRVKALRMPSF